jgi:hypothetical protein
VDNPVQVADALEPEQQQMLAQARELIAGGNERGVTLRALGGIAIACQCPSALVPPLARSWKDLDLVALSSQRAVVEEYLESQGLQGDTHFNALHGHQRMNFVHAEKGYDVDVFIDRLVMCHTLDLVDRLQLDEQTLTPADLLLSKLQVVETNARDYLDIAALLYDNEIDRVRIVEVLSQDWGWWRTATEVLRRSSDYVRTLDDFEGRDPVLAQIARLEQEIEDAPKSRGWRMRARLGERKRWYELPEEDDEGI